MSPLVSLMMDQSNSATCMGFSSCVEHGPVASFVKRWCESLLRTYLRVEDDVTSSPQHRQCWTPLANNNLSTTRSVMNIDLIAIIRHSWDFGATSWLRAFYQTLSPGGGRGLACETKWQLLSCAWMSVVHTNQQNMYMMYHMYKIKSTCTYK